MIVPSIADAGQGRAADTPLSPVGPIGEWLDIYTGNVSLRYHLIRDQETNRSNNLQAQQQTRGRVRFDQAGRYAVQFGVQSGAGFTSSWNNTGIGTGDPTAHVFLKHLYGEAIPVKGLDIAYGSIPLLRGEVSELASYDNDGYIAGGRVTVKRPKELWLDQVAVTIAYLGDLKESNVFPRLEHLDRQNFRQVLVGKQITGRVAASADYVDNDVEGRLLRAGARVKIGERWLDAVRIEQGVWLTGPKHDTAFGITGEHTVNRLTLFEGFSHVDPNAASLNGDRYGIGDRLFVGGAYALPHELSIGFFAHRELDAPQTTTSKTRFDLSLTWNVLQALKRAGVMRAPSS